MLTTYQRRSSLRNHHELKCSAKRNATASLVLLDYNKVMRDNGFILVSLPFQYIKKKKEKNDMPPVSGVPLEQAKPLTASREPASSEHTNQIWWPHGAVHQPPSVWLRGCVWGCGGTGLPVPFNLGRWQGSRGRVREVQETRVMGEIRLLLSRHYRRAPGCAMLKGVQTFVGTIMLMGVQASTGTAGENIGGYCKAHGGANVHGDCSARGCAGISRNIPPVPTHRLCLASPCC